MKANTFFSESAHTPWTSIRQYNQQIALLFQFQHNLIAKRNSTALSPSLLKEIDEQIVMLDAIISFELTH